MVLELLADSICQYIFNPGLAFGYFWTPNIIINVIFMTNESKSPTLSNFSHNSAQVYLFHILYISHHLFITEKQNDLLTWFSIQGYRPTNKDICDFGSWFRFKIPYINNHNCMYII